MPISEAFESTFFNYVDMNTDLYIERLREAVAVQSVSSNLDAHLSDINYMMEWTAAHIHRLCGDAKLMPNPLSSQDKVLPPILLGEFVVDPSKKTVCVYGHLDVQPADKSDGWNTDPFVLTEIDGKLFGRGSTDDKGPALSWLWVIEAYKHLGEDLPVNIKLLYEGMEESGSEGMEEAIVELVKPGGFLNDVDFFCISDNYWTGKRKPCITYGLRGLAAFMVTVQCCEQDLHSGVIGGTINEAMTDLVYILASLKDPTGKILIEGIMDDVLPVTPEEQALYRDIDFDVESFKEEVRVGNYGNRVIQEDKESILMARWRFPSLTIHGIHGAFSGEGVKTVVPAKVTGKFSIRTVPNMILEKVKHLVQAHVEKEFAKLRSPNKMTFEYAGGGNWWLSDIKHPNYKAAAKAIKKVFGVSPDYNREGGSIPIAQMLEYATKMNVMLLPVGACDDMAHSQNEKYNRINLINAIKVLGIYICELGEIRGPKPSKCRCDPLTDEDLMIPGAFVRGFGCKCQI